MILLIITLVISFLNAFISYLSPVVLYFIKDKSGIDDLKNEIAILNEQKRHLSIVDEFPKYARLDRKIDQLRQEIGKKALRRMVVNSTVTYSLQAAIMLTSVLVFWIYRWTPVAVVPSDWLSPFSRAVSWPTGEPGAIGFPVWFLACNSLAKLLAKAFVK